jgi:hypothetical protein
MEIYPPWAIGTPSPPALSSAIIGKSSSIDIGNHQYRSSARINHHP